MRIARFSVADQIAFGVVEGDLAAEPGSPDAAHVTAIDGHPFGPFERTSVRLPLGEVRLLAPVAAEQGDRHRQELRRPRRGRWAARRRPTR